MTVLSLPHDYPDDSVLYVATTLLHVRPFNPLYIDLLHYCQAPISLQALAALSGWSTTTVAWLLCPLLQHGLVKRLPLLLPFDKAEEAQ